MRALVTGGTGFIGANLVAGLAEREIQARVLRRAESSEQALEGLVYETVIGDVLDEPDVLARAMEGCDWVFHVAAVSDYWRQDRDRLYRVNVEGTRRVVTAAKRAGVHRLVFTSSLAAMGVPAERGRLLTERDRCNLPPARFPYADSKCQAEDVVMEAVAAGLDGVIVNPSVVLGPRDVNEISGAIILEAARGLLRFTVPGGMNFIDVQDVVAGHIAAAERGRVGERYILGNHNLAYDEAIAIICDVVGRPRPRLHVPAWILPPVAVAVRAARWVFGNLVPLDENQVRMLSAVVYADNSKARRELDLPQTPFRATVQQTYNWYNGHGYLDERIAR
jgi:dihydroflavonol-4-reductase